MDVSSAEVHVKTEVLAEEYMLPLLKEEEVGEESCAETNMDFEFIHVKMEHETERLMGSSPEPELLAEFERNLVHPEAGCGFSNELTVVHDSKDEMYFRLPQVAPKNLWEDYSANVEGFSCNQCHQQSDDESMMKRHMLEEHCKTKLHMCAICNAELENKSQLRDHVKLHLDEGKWTCPEPCGEVFDRKKDLVNHLKDLGRMEPKCFRCNVCDRRCLSNSMLDMHLLIHTNEKNFKCLQCDRAFTRKSDLKHHKQQLHDDVGDKKRFACSECSKAYTRRVYLMSHINSEHTNSQPVRCTVCDKGFSANSHLLDHMRIHTGERPFTCDICNSAFIQKSYLNTHMLFHKGEKRFTCDVCDAAFTLEAHLKRHMLIHSGVKPFACKFCDFRSNRKSSLKRHVNGLH